MHITCLQKCHHLCFQSIALSSSKDLHNIQVITTYKLWSLYSRRFAAEVFAKFQAIELCTCNGALAGSAFVPVRTGSERVHIAWSLAYRPTIAYLPQPIKSLCPAKFRDREVAQMNDMWPGAMAAMGENLGTKKSPALHQLEAHHPPSGKVETVTLGSGLGAQFLCVYLPN